MKDPPCEFRTLKGETMESRLIELEMRVAHYEQTLDDLNGVITRQKSEIQNLERQVEMILAHIRNRETGEAIEL